jgi:hypothetical protein
MHKFKLGETVYIKQVVGEGISISECVKEDFNGNISFQLQPEPKCKTCGQEWTNHEPSALAWKN